MLKFFRKYNKIILVIGGAFLMVSFLLMDSISRMGPMLGLSQTYVKIEGKKVDYAAFGEANKELNLVRNIAPEVLQLIGIDSKNLAEHWYLLTYEAEKAGIIGGPGDGGAEFAATAATLVADRIAQEQRNQFGGFGDISSFISSQRESNYTRFVQQFAANRERMLQSGQPQRRVDMALAKMRGIIRLLESQPGFDTLSRPQAVAYAEDLFDTAFVRIGVIPANIRETVIGSPSEQEIAEHFETYKSQRPGDNELGIGYLLEPAVRVQTLSIDRQQVIDALRVDEIEVNKYWLKNKARFGEEWSSAKDAATGAFKDELAQKVLDRAVRVVQRETLRSTRDLETVSGYKVLPGDWNSKKIRFEAVNSALQQELSREFGFDMVLPVYRPETDLWLDRSALVSMRGGIGSAQWRLNDNVSIPFPDLVLNAKSLGGNAELAVQQGIVLGPLESPQGVYFARIEGTRAEGEPEKIDDDLRERLVEDIRSIKVYEDLKSAADEYASQLAAGFDDAFAQIAPAGTVQDAEITRRSTAAPGQLRVLDRFNTAPIRDTVMDRVQGWDPRHRRGA